VADVNTIIIVYINTIDVDLSSLNNCTNIYKHSKNITKQFNTTTVSYLTETKTKITQ